MKNTKDTFYVTLRDRLVTVNATRTFVLRGLVRPGIVVPENELATAVLPADVFILRWTELRTDTLQAMPVVTMRCELTTPQTEAAVVPELIAEERFAKMDAELLKILAPQATVKKDYSVTPAKLMQSSIFWSDAVFEPIVVNAERLERVAYVDVTSYEEPGE